MNKNVLNFIFLIIFLIFVSVPIFTSSLLDLKQQEKNEAIYQKILAEQDAQKEIEKNYLMGKFEPSQRKDFVAVSAKYNVSGYKTYLRKETMNAFIKMAEDAEKNDVDLSIISATRNFNYQKDLWNNKWTGVTLVDKQDLLKTIPDGLERFKKILEFSAVPGTSRHHWGTDIDINNVNPPYFESTKGEKEYAWLVKNASLFGFCQTYTLKGSIRPEGYNEEKWHWSYLPLAKVFTKEYKDLIKEKDITGFNGDEYVVGQDLINKQVLGINPDCL